MLPVATHYCSRLVYDCFNFKCWAEKQWFLNKNQSVFLFHCTTFLLFFYGKCTRWTFLPLRLRLFHHLAHGFRKTWHSSWKTSKIVSQGLDPPSPPFQSTVGFSHFSKQKCTLWIDSYSDFSPQGSFLNNLQKCPSNSNFSHKHIIYSY